MDTNQKKEVQFSYQNGKVKRAYSKEWSNSGTINIDRIPDLVSSVIEQRSEMVLYIEALHDKLDFIMEKNSICSIPGCHTAGCTSDHK